MGNLPGKPIANHSRLAQRQVGFTLVELMVVLAIATLLITVAAPSWRLFMASQHHNVAVNELLLAFRFTRSEAIKSGQRVTACTRSGNALACGKTSWHQGWLIFIDSNNNGLFDDGEKLLRQHAALNSQVSATGNTRIRHYISYTPLGSARSVGSRARIRGGLQLGTLSVCTQGLPRGSQLVLSRSGRVDNREKRDCAQ